MTNFLRETHTKKGSQAVWKPAGFLNLLIPTEKMKASPQRRTAAPRKFKIYSLTRTPRARIGLLLACLLISRRSDSTSPEVVDGQQLLRKLSFKNKQVVENFFSNLSQKSLLTHTRTDFRS